MFITKQLSLEQFGKDLTKKVSTSGIVYILSKVRNSIIQLAPSTPISGVILNIENLSELLTSFRAQGENFQYQLSLGPNQLAQIYLPLSDSYILSTTQDLKISSISTYLFFPDAYDLTSTPNPAIQVSSSTPLLVNKDHDYESRGLINIFLKQNLGAEDVLAISSVGADCVWRIADVRIRAFGSFVFVVPGKVSSPVIALGSQESVAFKIKTHKKVKLNPAYVAPEAALWSLENGAT